MGGLWPLNTGGRLRSYHIISELSKRHDVTVLTTHKSGENPDLLAEQLPHCRQVASFPHDPPKWNSLRFLGTLARSWFSPLPVDLYKTKVNALTAEARRLLSTREFDLCVADFLFATPNVTFEGKSPTMFFSHNVEHMIWKRLCESDNSILRRPFLELEWRKMRRYESDVCRRASLTVTVSPEDRRIFENAVPDCNAFDIPTGVDIDYFQSDVNHKVRENHLVFSGSMDWYPNEDAMLYFINEILPRIRNQIPDVSLTVVGRNPSDYLKRIALQANVEVTGSVDDIRPYVDEATLYIVPLRIGGGTRLKIFEALAMAKPVIATTVGAEGLPLEDGVHFSCADNPHSFADAVVSLLHDENRRASIGKAGRELVEEKYSWSLVTDEFETLCFEALGPRARVAG